MSTRNRSFERWVAWLALTFILIPVVSSGQTMQKLYKETMDVLDTFTGEWSSFYGDRFTYDETGRLILRSGLGMDPIDTVGYPSDRSVYTYHPNGKVATITLDMWEDNDSIWLPVEKEENLYNAGDCLTQHTLFYWDTLTRRWKPNTTEAFSYNESGQLNEYIYSLWDTLSNTWLPYLKQEISYQDEGYRSVLLNYDWKLSQNRWIPATRMEYTYNGKGKQTLQLGFVRDTTDTAWIPSSQGITEYDPDGNYTYLLRNWSPQTGQWSDQTRDLALVDEFGNLIRTTHYRWYSDSLKWGCLDRIDYAYDLAHSKNDLLLPPGDFYTGLSYKLDSITYRLWFESSNDFTINYRQSYHYTPITINHIDQYTANPVLVYPNPASDRILISLPSASESNRFELFDQSGRKVLIRQLAGTLTTVPVSQLTSGTYFYTVRSRTTFFSGMIMVKKQ